MTGSSISVNEFYCQGAARFGRGSKNARVPPSPVSSGHAARMRDLYGGLSSEIGSSSAHDLRSGCPKTARGPGSSRDGCSPPEKARPRVKKRLSHCRQRLSRASVRRSPKKSGNPSFDTTVRRRPDRSRPPLVGQQRSPALSPCSTPEEHAGPFAQDTPYGLRDSYDGHCV